MVAVGRVVHRRGAAVAMPWRNGGGSTTELTREPRQGDAFDWRVSVAEVAADGPFSEFSGYDRVIVLLAGDGMNLRFDDTGEVVTLRTPLDALRFDGERPVSAHLVGGPTTDLNLIWRRAAFDAEAAVVEAAGSRIIGNGDGTTLVHIVRGEIEIDGDRAASAGDLVEWRGAQVVVGDATAVVFTVSSREA